MPRSDKTSPARPRRFRDAAVRRGSPALRTDVRDYLRTLLFPRQLVRVPVRSWGVLP